MADAPAPRISVMLPMYNMGKYVKQCINTLAQQTFHDFEMIAVDDCSTDNTLDLLYSCAEKEPRLRVIALNQNGGTFVARKAALAAARGEYVTNLDADDFLDGNAFEQLVKVMDKTHADIICFGGREVDGVTGKHLGRTVDSTPFTLEGTDVFDAEFRSHAYSWSLCMKLIRRDLFLNADAKLPSGYCIFAEDFMHFTVIASMARSLVSTGTIYYNYRRNTGITGTEPRTLAQFRRSMSMFFSLKSIRHYLEENGLYQGYANAFSLREKEQIRMLYKQWAHQLTPDDQKLAYGEMQKTYDATRIDVLFTEFAAEEQNGSSCADTPSRFNKIFRPESLLWRILKKLAGKWKFKKGKRFYDR